MDVGGLWVLHIAEITASERRLSALGFCNRNHPCLEASMRSDDLRLSRCCLIDSQSVKSLQQRFLGLEYAYFPHRA